MEIENKDNVTSITLSDENGTTNYIIENGNLYEVDENKSIFKISPQKKMLIENAFSSINFDENFSGNQKNSSYSLIDIYFKDFGSPISIDENIYTFKMNKDNSEISVVVDDKINKVVQMTVIDGVFKTVTAMKYTYESFDGHIVLSKVESAEVSIYPSINNISYTTMIFENLK
ncbi:MAG TPA: hypothetical protein PLX16_08470 [Exilispira sp.]|nr:hypothetical protein [Exilispira sp.]